MATRTVPPALAAARGRRALMLACSRAKGAAKSGSGQAALGRLIGRRQSAIWNFLQTGLADPAACLAIERTTGVPARALRPDLAAIFCAHGKKDAPGLLRALVKVTRTPQIPPSARGST